MNAAHKLNASGESGNQLLAQSSLTAGTDKEAARYNTSVLQLVSLDILIAVKQKLSKKTETFVSLIHKEYIAAYKTAKSP